MISRKDFLKHLGLAGTLSLTLNQLPFDVLSSEERAVKVRTPQPGEDLFAYINEEKGKFDLGLYRQLIGAANDYKEGDDTQGIAAMDDSSRQNARTLLAQTRIKDLMEHSLFTDELKTLIDTTTDKATLRDVEALTMAELKAFLLSKPESEIKEMMPGHALFGPFWSVSSLFNQFE